MDQLLTDTHGSKRREPRFKSIPICELQKDYACDKESEDSQSRWFPHELAECDDRFGVDMDLRDQIYELYCALKESKTTSNFFIK